MANERGPDPPEWPEGTGTPAVYDAGRGSRGEGVRPEASLALTPLQREIVVLVANGYTNARIAERLGMTAGGVAVQVGRIVQRLGLTTRAEIALWVKARGLLH